MARLCERPGCSAAAAVAYGFDADRLLVWLLPHDPSDEPLRAGVLCRRHADAMIVPRGWTLDDRRDVQPRLFRSPATSVPPKPRPRRRPPAEPRPEQQLVLEAVVSPATPEPDETAPSPSDELTVADVTGAPPPADGDETMAMPWRPAFDERDDLGGVLAAETPLLARAFKRTDRVR